MGTARRRRGDAGRGPASLRQCRREDCLMSAAVDADLQVGLRKTGLPNIMSKKDEIREKALKDLQQFQVLMLNGHFDFANGYHGALYLNPHQLFRYPSTIWRFAQDLLDVLPASVLDETEVVAGPTTGG